MRYADINSNRIGMILKQLREKAGITLAEMSDGVGISQSAAAMYESGKRIPRDEIKIRIAKYYGLTVEAIFYAHEQHESCCEPALMPRIQHVMSLPNPLDMNM